MNSHLNIFKTYAKKERKHQLENDLTRALAICFQEDTLFFHEALKYILSGSNRYNQLFEDLDSIAEINIEIQENTSRISDFEHIYAISLSEFKMNEASFWEQKHNKKYDPICDLVIRINNITFIFEAKRDNVDCTAQLYNQVFNVFQQNEMKLAEEKGKVTPLDLNWRKLMEISVKTLSFEKATGNENRFLSDFIRLVKNHNFRWLPESPIKSLAYTNKTAIERRVESAVEELTKQFNISKLNNRLGTGFPKPWAQEILFSVSKDGNLVAEIYPGNTKGQGGHLFVKDPKFADRIKVMGKEYDVGISGHIKFTSFQKYFAGLWFGKEDLQKELYTKHNFWTYSGRKKRDKDWDNIEAFLDSCFIEEYNWKSKCHWKSKIVNSGKNQFDISFGYYIGIHIPFKTLQEIDSDKDDLTGLTNLLKGIYDAYQNQLLI